MSLKEILTIKIIEHMPSLQKWRSKQQRHFYMEIIMRAQKTEKYKR